MFEDSEIKNIKNIGILSSVLKPEQKQYEAFKKILPSLLKELLCCINNDGGFGNLDFDERVKSILSIIPQSESSPDQLQLNDKETFNLLSSVAKQFNQLSIDYPKLSSNLKSKIFLAISDCDIGFLDQGKEENEKQVTDFFNWVQIKSVLNNIEKTDPSSFNERGGLSYQIEGIVQGNVEEGQDIIYSLLALGDVTSFFKADLKGKGKEKEEEKINTKLHRLSLFSKLTLEGSNRNLDEARILSSATSQISENYIEWKFSKKLKFAETFKEEVKDIGIFSELDDLLAEGLPGEFKKKLDEYKNTAIAYIKENSEFKGEEGTEEFYKKESINRLILNKLVGVMEKEMNRISGYFNLSQNDPELFAQYKENVVDIRKLIIERKILKRLNAYKNKKESKTISEWMDKHQHIPAFQLKERRKSVAGLLEIAKNEEKGVFSVEYAKCLSETIDTIKDPKSELRNECILEMTALLDVYLNKPKLLESEPVFFEKIDEAFRNYLAQELWEHTIEFNELGRTKFKSDSLVLFAPGDTVGNFFRKLGRKLENALPFGSLVRLNQDKKDQELLGSLQLFLLQGNKQDLYKDDPAKFYTDALMLSTQVISGLFNKNLKERVKRIQTKLVSQFVNDSNVKQPFTQEQLKEIYVALKTADNASALPPCLERQKIFFNSSSYTKSLFDGYQISQEVEFENKGNQKPAKNNRMTNVFERKFRRDFRNKLLSNEVISAGEVKTVYADFLSSIVSGGKEGGAQLDKLLNMSVPLFGGLAYLGFSLVTNELKEENAQENENVGGMTNTLKDLDTFSNLLTHKLMSRYEYLIDCLELKSLEKFINLAQTLILEKAKKGDLSIKNKSLEEIAEILVNDLLMSEHSNHGAGFWIFKLKTSSEMIEGNGLSGKYVSGPNLESAIGKPVIIVLPKDGDLNKVKYLGKDNSDPKNGYVVLTEGEFETLKNQYPDMNEERMTYSEPDLDAVKALLGSTPEEQTAKLKKLCERLYPKGQDQQGLVANEEVVEIVVEQEKINEGGLKCDNRSEAEEMEMMKQEMERLQEELKEMKEIQKELLAFVKNTNSVKKRESYSPTFFGESPTPSNTDGVGNDLTSHAYTL